MGERAEVTERETAVYGAQTAVLDAALSSGHAEAKRLIVELRARGYEIVPANDRESDRTAREVALASVVWLASDGDDDIYEAWKSTVEKWKELMLDGE